MFLEFLSFVGLDLKSVVTAVISALIGGFLRWLFDRKEKANLRLQTTQLTDQVNTLTNTLTKTHARLENQENENKKKQRELERLEEILAGKGADIEAREDKLENLLDTLRDNEVALWAKFQRQAPFPDYDARIARRKPIIITIANLKGGVGKTTLTGNLLGYFDKIGKRVLALDLDYQGSLTTMLRSCGDPTNETASVIKLFSPDADLGYLYTATRDLGPTLQRSRLAPAFYEFALFEEYLMIDWLLQQSTSDVRYRLANLLLQDEVADYFDIVLADVPPRMTTGTINALCASTHVLIPAIFNPLSAEPVDNFLTMSKGLMDRLNPKLKFLGIVETMAPRANEARDVRAQGRRMIEEALNRSFPGIHILESSVPRRKSIAGAGVPAVSGDRATRRIFEQLGNELLMKAEK